MTQDPAAPRKGAEQKQRGENCANAMRRHVNETVQHEKYACDERGEAKPLIRPFAHWKNLRQDERKPDEYHRDGDPSRFAPEPQPIALGMNRAHVVE